MAFLQRFVLLALLMPMTAWAQLVDNDIFKYQMQGAYQLDGTDILPDNRFIVKWNELGEQIRGVYSDNYFATTDIPVAGTIQNGSRIFHVNLPDVTRGVKYIEIMSLGGGISSGTVSVTVNNKNSIGQTVNTYVTPVLQSIDPIVTEIVDQGDPAISCVIGMGALTGHCGRYQGSIVKYSDGAGMCLYINQNSTLELTPTGDFYLHLPLNSFSVFGLTNTNTESAHYLGSLNGAGPVTPTVDVRRIHCDTLAGTTFEVGQHCLTLALVGNFTTYAGVRVFAGTYRIEKSATESCTFNLSLERQ